MSEFEKLLNALLNGENVDFKPKSRMEQILLNCCKGLNCDGMSAPTSRAEVLLRVLSEKSLGGIIEVDELPTEDIKQGVAYVCDGDIYFYKEGGNTWVFNDVLTLDNTVNCSFGFKFTENDEEITGTGIRFNSYGGSVPHLVYDTDQFEPWGSPKYVTVYAYDESYDGTVGWRNEGYKTITITEMPTDEAFLDWLNANATPASGWVKYAEVGGKLYINDNGTYDVTNYKDAVVNIVIPPVIEVDELPTENIDNTAVYVYNDDLYRALNYVTYELNDVITNPFSGTQGGAFYNSFWVYPNKSDGNSLEHIAFSPEALSYKGDIEEFVDGNWVQRFESTPVYDFSTNTWADNKYRTIIFNTTEEYLEYMDEALLAWLKANGKRKYFHRYTLATE